jgi:SNF2 family DNA or RNA helicase
MQILLTQQSLRPWQVKAAEILSNHDYQLLGAQPGCGKTITTLTAIAAKHDRTLLVAPAVILDTVWAQEAAAWSHTCHLIFDMAHRHSGAERARLWFDGRADVVTCTPDTLVRLLQEVHRRERLPVTRMVVDESQFFKNPTAARTMALHVLAEHVPTWLLSGTPTPNGLLDCWSPGWVLSRGGRFWQ